MVLIKESPLQDIPLKVTLNFFLNSAKFSPHISLLVI